MTPGRSRSSRAVLAAFAAIAGLFALDFHLDTRERDVFSWMDPYQYYEFSLGVMRGTEPFDGFEIPSIFPFFVVPFVALDASIPGSLRIQVAAVLLLLFAIHGLCRELKVRTPSPLVALLVLSSPILVGLARTLYVELMLTALTSLSFLCWLRFLRKMDRRSGALFGVATGIAYMTKITFPVFLFGPVAGAVLARVAERRQREAVELALAAATPIVAALLIHALVFSPSAGYYLNLVSTSRPFMFLMGPPEIGSWSSASYYFAEVWRSFLLLLAPLLAIPALAALQRGSRFRWSDLASPRAGLWLWLIGPLVLLIAHPLKEPRHAAPCVVPAVLLIVLGIEALPSRAWRAALVTVALVLAFAQFAAVTSGRLEKPYFLDGPLHHAELRSRMLSVRDRGFLRDTPPELSELQWSFDQNVAIAGFSGNEALALTWQAFPGIVFDLETLGEPARLDDAFPYRSFEDLFFLSGVNTYNRRCGWRWYHQTLDRETVVANADFVLVRGTAPRALAQRFPAHRRIATVERESGSIHVLQATRPTTPYRVLYAREFLARRPVLAKEELRAIAEELLITSVLGGDDAGARAVMREFPVLRDARVKALNIYWIGGYPALLDLTRQRLDRMSR